MFKRICWKKGMRLSDDVLRASDEATAAWVGNALVLASAGQFGLFPGVRPFHIAVNVNNNMVEVASLNCIAVTKGGNLIDLHFDTKYSNSTQCRLSIPKDNRASELFLTINTDPEQWKETLDGYEEPVYDFDLVDTNNPISDNALPVAHLVNTDYGSWHVDEIDFVPPCLFVSSHPQYEKLLEQFIQTMKETERQCRVLIHSEGREAIRIFWPIVQQVLIDTDRGRDLLTPMTFMANIQKVICAFTTACDLDEYLNLADAEAFRNYSMTGYNYKRVYAIIKEGLEFCHSINEKLDKIQISAPKKSIQKLAAPFISEDQLCQNCKSCHANIPVINPTIGTTVYYSTDGNEPTLKLPNNGVISIENGFNKKKTPEPDKTIIVKLRTIGNEASSDVVSFTITLHKDYKVWDGYEI